MDSCHHKKNLLNLLWRGKRGPTVRKRIIIHNGQIQKAYMPGLQQPSLEQKRCWKTQPCFVSNHSETHTWNKNQLNDTLLKLVKLPPAFPMEIHRNKLRLTK